MYIIAHWNGHGIRVGCMICGEGFELVLVRRIGADLPPVPDGADLLTGSWTGVDAAVLALIR